jgi:hypothetical protein
LSKKRKIGRGSAKEILPRAVGSSTLLQGVPLAHKQNTPFLREFKINFIRFLAFLISLAL